MFEKIALTIITLVLLGSMAGCSATPTGSTSSNSNDINQEPSATESNPSIVNKQLLPIIQSKGAKLILDETADGSSQTVAIDDLMAIVLVSNPSTGFSWFAKSSNPEVIDQEGDPEYIQPASNSSEPVVGAPGTEVLYFKPTSTGSATLTLEYKRGWENNVTPAKIITINVYVK
jgi:predicted secreted protein